MSQLNQTLLLAGLLAGLTNYFINYLKLPQPGGKSLFSMSQNWSVIVLGYLIIGIAGAFLTPLLDALIVLKGYLKDITKPGSFDFPVIFGYGLVFGYAFSRVLNSILDVILKRLENLESQKLNDNIITSEGSRVDSKLLLAKPDWNKVYEGYPKDNNNNDLKADEVFKSVRGENYDRDIFQNACATRVSLGLLNAGVNVKKDFLISVGRFKGKGFIASAVGLKNWLRSASVLGKESIKIKAPINLNDLKGKIGKRNGIYIIVGGFNTASGHATLWVGSTQDVIGGSNYSENEGEIYFWEL